MIGSLTIQLPTARGSLTLSGSFNAFDLVGDERALVFALLDLMQEFEAKHKPAPIASSVDADLDPLKQELVEAGRKLANAIGWRCVACHTLISDTSIDLGTVVCGCGLGKGRWGVEVSDDPPSQGKEGR